MTILSSFSVMSFQFFIIYFLVNVHFYEVSISSRGMSVTCYINKQLTTTFASILLIFCLLIVNKVVVKVRIMDVEYVLYKY